MQGKVGLGKIGNICVYVPWSQKRKERKSFWYDFTDTYWARGGCCGAIYPIPLIFANGLICSKD